MKKARLPVGDAVLMLCKVAEGLSISPGISAAVDVPCCAHLVTCCVFVVMGECLRYACLSGSGMCSDDNPVCSSMLKMVRLLASKQVSSWELTYLC